MDWLGHSRLTSKDLSKGFRVCEGADFKLDLHEGGSDHSIVCKW